MQIVRVRRGPTVPPYYAPTSFFNRTIGAADSLAADQTPAQNLANQIQYGRQGRSFTGYSGVGFGFYSWPWSLAFIGPASSSFPIYAVRPSDPAQNISFQRVKMCFVSNGTYVTYGSEYPDLEAATLSVPMPDKALCPKITGTAPYQDIWSGDSSTDQDCIIINEDTGECWEFIKLTNSRAPNIQQAYDCTWTCLFSGYTADVFTFDGVYPKPGGSRACNLGSAGGLITMQDAVNVFNGGAINHAIIMAVPFNDRTWVPPARRGDGLGANGNSVVHIPAGQPGAGAANPAFGFDKTREGMRLRFPANVDLSAITYPMGLAIARAIRDYGLIIVDTASACGVYIEDYRTMGSPYNLQGAGAVDPYSLAWPTGQWGGGWRGNVTSGFTVLHELPWDQLQLLTPVAS